MAWKDQNGFEGAVSNKVAPLTSTAGDNIAPLVVTAKYYRRWKMPFNPFSNFKESQIAWIVGVEYYKNYAAGSYFSTGDTFLKSGISLLFPVSRRWDTGGELLAGYAADTSQEYELSGVLRYYMNEDWSFGFGYRMNIYNIGNVNNTPNGLLPYKESFGEAYTTLKWNY
jgi:hypothetical protein